MPVNSYIKNILKNRDTKVILICVYNILKTNMLTLLYVKISTPKFIMRLSELD